MVQKELQSIKKAIQDKQEISIDPILMDAMIIGTQATVTKKGNKELYRSLIPKKR